MHNNWLKQTGTIKTLIAIGYSPAANAVRYSPYSTGRVAKDGKRVTKIENLNRNFKIISQ